LTCPQDAVSFLTTAIEGENTMSLNSGKKILIADDDPAILESLQMILEMEGYEVHATPFGERVEKMSKEHPDLMFLDIWMSGVDGRNICKKIKSGRSTKEIPVIMISATHDVKKSAYDSGADDFIAKPFQLKELLSKVEKHISSN
jgi:DNA-binding response OmpR family regulator